jgi:hypothetical protein
MSQHSTPIVPTVLLIGDQRHPWRLSQLERLTTSYHTPTTVRLMPGGMTKHQHHVYCLVDDSTWELAQATQAALQQQLDDLAAGLRELGSYAKRLAEAGGMKSAPNPLCFDVITAPDPDTSEEGHWFTNQLVPRIERKAIRGHTPKMLRDARYSDGSVCSQRDHFVCPTDADWAQIEQLEQAAQAKANAWEQLLRELGTYQAALADGRYRKPVVIPQLDLRGPSFEPAQPPVPNWPQITGPLIYGHHRNASSGGVTHVWQPAPTPRSKQRHETLCHIVMTEPPTPVIPSQVGQPSPRLCPECRGIAAGIVAGQRAEANRKETSVTTTTAQPRLLWPDLPTALQGWRWSANPKTKHHFLMHPKGGHIFTTRHYPDHMDAIAEAQRWVLSQPKPKVTAAHIRVRPANTIAETDIDGELMTRLMAGGYHWEMAKQTPDGRWHHLISSRNTALLRNDQVLLRRERLEALLTPPSALATTDQPFTAVPMMDQAEARETLDAMRSDLGQIELSLSSFRQRALDFADRQGWKALGYNGAAEAINAELGVQYSKSYLSRLLGAARIEKILELPIGNSVPESQLRPLASLDTPNQQRQAWQAATTASNGKPTTGAVQQAVQEIKPTRPNAPAGWVWRDNNSLRRIADGQIVGPYARLVDVVSAAEQMDREHADQQHMAQVNQILTTLDQWDDGARPARLQEAYGHARQISNLALHDQAFALIDAAVEGKSTTPAPDFDDAQRRAQALGWSLAKHGAWWKLTQPDGVGYTTFEPRRQLDTIERLEREAAAQQPDPGPTAISGKSELAPITIQTNQGPREIVPLWSNGTLAQHAADGRFVLTHVPTGKAIASFARHSNAGRALDQLALLDWQLTPEGGLGPILGLAVARIVTQFDDVDHLDVRRARLAELEAAAQPPAIEAPAAPVPADWEARYDEAEALATKALEYADGSHRYYDPAKAVAAALELASYLAGERLEDLAEQLGDAEYEALAAYRRARAPVPTLADLEEASA